MDKIEEEPLIALMAWEEQLLDMLLAQLRICREVDLVDELIYLRVTTLSREEMFSAPEGQIDATVREMWADRIEYVDPYAFRLWVSAAEPNIFFNHRFGGALPGRLPDTQEAIVIRCDDREQGPSIPTIYLLPLYRAVYLAVERLEGRTTQPHIEPFLQEQIIATERHLRKHFGVEPLWPTGDGKKEPVS